MYKWLGDSNLFIPRRGVKIKRQETFELSESELKMSGVQRLVEEGLIIAVTEESPVVTEETPEEITKTVRGTKRGKRR